MMHGQSAAELRFRGQTGEPRFDGSQFSGQPQARLLTRSDYALIVHEGLIGVDVGYCEGKSDGWEVLMLSRGMHGKVISKCAGEHFEKEVYGKRVTFLPDGIDLQSIFPAHRSAVQLIFPKGYLKRRVEQLTDSELPLIYSINHHSLARLIGMLEREMANPDFGSSLVTDGIISAIAAILSRADLNRVNDEAARISLTPAKLRRVVDFIEANLESDIGLSEIAGAADLSAFHFSRVFKLSTGETPYHYLRSRRIERARKMLLQDDLPLAELSLACGFSNQSHFTAAFTREIGMSPGRFRRQASTAR